MLFLYLHFSTTAKVPQPKMLQITKVIINKFLWPTNMKGNKKFMKFRFNSVLIRFLTVLLIFASLVLQTTHLSHEKNDVTTLLSSDITPIFFSVRTYMKLKIPLSLPLPWTNKLLKWNMFTLCGSSRWKMSFITGNFKKKETPTQVFSCEFCEEIFFHSSCLCSCYVHFKYENALTAEIPSL